MIAGFEELDLDPHEVKALGKLGRVLRVGPDAASILCVDCDEYAKLPGVGALSVEPLRRIQQKLRDAGATHDSPMAQGRLEGMVARYGERHLRAHALRRADLSSLQRLILQRMQGDGPDVSLFDILSVDSQAYRRQPGIGESKCNALVGLQLLAVQGLEEQDSLSDSLETGYDGILVGLRSVVVVDEELDATVDLLLTVISQSDLPAYRALAALYGIDRKRETLDKRAQQLGLTRERVRQVVAVAWGSVAYLSRLHRSVVRFNLERRSDTTLARIFPRSLSRFDREVDLPRFLERFVGTQMPSQFDGRGEASDAVKISLEPLHRLIATTKSPIPRDAILETLSQELSFSADEALRFFAQLEDHGHLTESVQGYRVRGLPQVLAVEHAAMSFPRGAHFKEIVAHVNQLELTFEPMNGERVPLALQISKRTFLWGTGTYRHDHFWPFDEDVAKKALDLTREYLETRCSERSENLFIVFRAVEQAFGADYFELRRCIVARGEEAGIYFQGASRRDTVSLDPDAPTVPLVEVAHRFLRASTEPVTMEEIASRIPSESLAMASQLVEQLRRSGRAVRVGRGVYADSDRIFSAADLDRLMPAAVEICAEAKRPVERSTFLRALSVRHEEVKKVAPWLDLHRVLAAHGRLHATAPFVSATDIPYKSVKTLVEAIFQRVSSRAEALEEMHREILVDPHVAESFWSRHRPRRR